MITPEQFQEIGETLLPLLDDLTEWIARDMIERFMIRFGRGEKKLLTGTDEWQAWVLKQAGGNLDEIQKALAKSTGKSQQEIAKIFKDSGIQAAKADAEAAAVTFSGLSPRMMAIITDAYERTAGEISNITRTTAGATNQAFIDICDAAYWKVRTGAQSYTAAMLDGIKELGQMQPIVRYPSGHKDTLEVAVLRCIRTGVAQSSGNMTIQQCKDMGWNHVLVSQHLGARVSDTDPIADHAGWQGKVYCIDGKGAQFDNLLDATGYPENPLGLCGYNCRHSFTPFLPGVSRNNNKPIDTEANRRAYELSQTQRAMERRIRAQKRKCAALHTAAKSCEDPAAKAKLREKYTQSAKRLQEQNAAYTKFCADNDLKPYHERLAVAGWDRSAASTASAAVREQKRVDKMIAEFNAEHMAKDPAELLPKHEYAHGVKEKLLNYSLNMKEGASGRDKAVVFQAALGYNANNYELLMQEIMAGVGRYKASGKTTTEHGEKFTVRMLVKGANGRYVPIRTGWIIAPEDRAPRMTTAFVDR